MELLIKKLGFFLIHFSCFGLSLNITQGTVYAAERSSKDALLESIHQRVRDLNARMTKMGASGLIKVEESPRPLLSADSLNNSDDFAPVPLQIKSRIYENKKLSPVSPVVPHTGFYLIPFGGVALSEDFKWVPPVGGTAVIQNKPGYSFGARLGYRWKYLYLEERISRLNSSFERIDFVGSGWPISGESNALSFHQSVGVNLAFNEWSGIEVGAGVGFSSQEFSILNVNGSNFVKDQLQDWVFSYDAIIGVFFQPVNYFRGSINYRWLRTESLERFSSADRHLIELALGLQF